MTRDRRGFLRALTLGSFLLARAVAGASGDPSEKVVVMAAGQFAQATAEPVGIDVAITVVGPDGVEMLAMDAVPAAGAETVAWIAAADGAHRIKVRPALDGSRGRFTLRLDGVRAPSDADRRRASAFGLLAEGRKLLADRREESTRHGRARLDQALAAWESLGSAREEAITRLHLGQAAIWLSEFPAALEHLRNAGERARAAGERAVEACAHHLAAEALYAQGKPDQALERLEAALEGWREIGDRRNEAQSLSSMGAILSARWDTARAREAYERALALSRELGDPEGEANTLSNLATGRIREGELQSALELLVQALEKHRARGARKPEAVTLGSLGVVYLRLADPERALARFEAALELWRLMGDRRGQGVTLSQIGTASVQAGRPEAALQAFTSALELRRGVGDRVGEAVVLVNLGELQRKRGDAAKAGPLLESGLSLARELADLDVQARALLGLALLQSDAGDGAAAHARALESLALRQRMRDQRGEALVLYHLARLERAAGDLEGARARVEHALRIIEALRGRLGSPDLRAFHVASLREVYDLHVDVLMALERAQPGRGLDGLALASAEQGRARSLLDLLGESRADIREGVEPALLERERSLRARLNGLAERRLRGGRAAAGADPTEEERLQLTTALEQAEAEIRTRSPRYATLTQPSPLSLREVQALLGPDTLLLEYALGDERSYVWAVDAGSLTSHELPPRAVVEAAARRAYGALSSRGPDVEAAGALSGMVLGPVAARLARRRLVIVADAALHYVPFAALPDPSGAGPLLERHEISGLPSAAVLSVLRRAREGRARSTRTLAVFADPVFDAADERLASRAPRSGGPAALGPVMRDVGLAGKPIPRLPFTRREARALQKVVPGRSALVALDFDASLARLTDPSLSQYRFVHFATHGFLDGTNPQLSGILLSLFDREGRSQPGYLATPDAFNLRLSADLVVLSGCRTGLGQEVRGEGLLGLARGFMYAGADRVVASLWKVDDSATAALMTELYRGMLGPARLSPSAALRAAQLAVRRQARFRHPFYWGAFQLQGEWN